ncbi:MAG: hypothetical protein ACKV22_19740 [Bryobacteraceae bacterium]
MSCLNFGRLEGLHVRHGQPVWDPPPRIVREVKLGGDNSPRPEASAPNFQLKEQVLELFTHIAELGDGVIDVLEVKHGLPFKLEHLKSS